MTVRRLEGIPGFSIDRVAGAAGNDPDVLRMENLDTDLPPPPRAVAATHAAIGRDDTNSYLPFTESQLPSPPRARQDRGYPHEGLGRKEQRSVLPAGLQQRTGGAIIGASRSG